VKVAILGYDHPVDDKRVFRTVKAISKYHDVVYIYRQDAGKKEIEEKLKREYPHVEFVPVVLKERSPEGIYAFDKENVEAVIESDADVWYLHTAPDTRPLQLFTEGKRRGKRLIYDSHELMPWNSFSRFTRGNRAVDMMRRVVLWSVYKEQIEKSDVVIQVSFSIKRYVERNLKVEEGKQIVIPNLAERVECLDIGSRRRERKVVYVGSTVRGISRKLIELLYEKYGYRFEYISSREEDRLKDLPYVRWQRPLGYEEMIEWLSRAEWSLMIFEHWNNLSYIYSLPHKYFDSLYAGVPVIVGKEFVEMAAWTKRYGVGIIIEGEDINLSGVDRESLQRNIINNREKFLWGERWEQRLNGIVEG